MINKSIIFTVIILSLVTLDGCKKEKPQCFKDNGVSDCNEMFDKIQQNLGDLEKSQELRDCYNKVCK